ncbi:MAG: SPFH domain-containing protein [Phycisphaerales bacterium JB063]
MPYRAGGFFIFTQGPSMIWDKLRNELVEVIEWLDDTNDTLVYRFEDHDHAIKYGAQLTVREGQSAVFVNEGKIADVFGPGRYELETKNLPILTKLMSWEYGFESPFKAEVYFVSTRQFTDRKWGTANPVILRDPSIGPVRIRAFGTYSFRAGDPAVLIREVVGTDGRFVTGQITDQLRHAIVSRFADVLGESRVPLYELASKYDELAVTVGERMSAEMSGYGLILAGLLIQNISLPEEVEKALDERSKMGVLGDMDAYMKLKSAEAIGDAAKQGGGAAGSMMGMGMGFAMGNQMAGQMAGAQQGGGAQAVPPPLPRAFYLAEQGHRHGPFDENVLRAMVGEGRVTRESLVWTAGMSGWSKAGEASATASLFSPDVPPPPPVPGG